MIGMLLRYVNSKMVSGQGSTVIFPIQGHSYMAVDRVFGRDEQDYRKQAIFTGPKCYDRILEKYGRTRKLWKD